MDSTSRNLVCDLVRSHYAYIHTQACADALPHNIQLEEPNFCDGFLIREQPVSPYFYLESIENSLSHSVYSKFITIFTIGLMFNYLSNKLFGPMT